MIFDARRLPLPLRLKADLCVIGTGPGGAMVSMLASEAGLRVVALEAGAWLPAARMTQREEQMFPLLYWDSGARTTADGSLRVHQGKGVGGSSLHNFNLCKRIPDLLLRQWHTERRLERLAPRVWHDLYAEVEALLGVEPIPEQRWNRHNRLLKDGCERLGWSGGGLLHNRTGCLGSGFCELGCRYDAKNNAAKVCWPRAVRASAEVLTHCQAVRVEHSRGRVSGVQAVAVDPESHAAAGRVEVEAPLVCLAASATGSAALLERSAIPDAGGETGKRLHVHPAIMAIGDWAEPVHAWRGIPQAYECTELLDFTSSERRLWIVPAFAHPMAAATLLPGHGVAHRAWIERYPHIGVFSAMLHDRTCGEVRAQGELGLRIEYWPDAADRRALMLGLWAVVHLLFAAGASRVLVPSSRPRVIQRGEPYDDLERLELTPGSFDLTSVHAMGSVPMGDDPTTAAVASSGAHHHVAGLWLADGSLFPSSIGVPPQLSIYALGLHVGRSLLESAGRS